MTGRTAGLPGDDGSEAYDHSDFTVEQPTLAEVLEARASRLRMVRDVVDGPTPAFLAAPRRNPHDAAHPEASMRPSWTICHLP